MSLVSKREDTWGILPLQNCILQIAQYIDSVCRDNDIDYCLMGGSALGAVRHNGFIPWDDDLDIFMTADNYELFRAVFLSNGDKDHYYLQELGKCGDMIVSAKLRKNNTKLIEPVYSGMDIHQGVFVDIFILHNSPSGIVQRYWQYIWARYIVIKGLSNRNLVRGAYLRRFLLGVFRLFPKRFLLSYALSQVYKYRNDDSACYCHLLGRAGIKKGTYLKKYFKKPIRHKFEEIELNVPFDAHGYLKDRFGDYMKLPSQVEIAHFQHTTEWSVDSSFPKVKMGIFEDEKYLF